MTAAAHDDGEIRRRRYVRIRLLGVLGEDMKCAIESLCAVEAPAEEDANCDDDVYPNVDDAEPDEHLRAVIFLLNVLLDSSSPQVDLETRFDAAWLCYWFEEHALEYESRVESALAFRDTARLCALAMSLWDGWKRTRPDDYMMRDVCSLVNEKSTLK